jgi:hypothetical protein
MHTRSTFSTVLSQLFAQHSAMVAMAENHEAQFDAADQLAELLNHAGHTAQVKAETDDDGVTVVIFSTLEPAKVLEFLSQRGIAAAMVDFFDNNEATIGTYAVRFHGVELALVAQCAKGQAQTQLREAA